MHGTLESIAEIVTPEQDMFLTLSKTVKDAIESSHREYFDNFLNNSVTEIQRNFIRTTNRRRPGRVTSPH